MGTDIKTLQAYLDLWEIFEKEIATNKNLPTNTLSGFAKYYEKIKDGEEGTDYRKVYDKLKKMKQRKNSLTRVSGETFSTLEEYYKCLGGDYILQELGNNEGYEGWFN